MLLLILYIYITSFQLNFGYFRQINGSRVLTQVPISHDIATARSLLFK